MRWNKREHPRSPWRAYNQPPDLEEALKKFQAKFKKAFGGGKNSNPKNIHQQKQGSGRWVVFGVFVIFFVLWTLSGIFIVNPAEQAAILRFGKYVETVGPGPHWIPPIIEHKMVKNVERVLDYSYSAQMLTKDENLVSVSLVVQYRIGDLKSYLFQVVDPQESLRQATSSALRQVVGTTTLDQIITEGREAWGAHVHDNLVKILDKYKTGIVIVNVSPQPARAPEPVQEAFDDAIKAQEDEKRFKEQAYAYQAQVVPIAQGHAKRILQEAKAYAEKTVLNAKGEAAGFLALLPSYQEQPFITTQRLYLDTIQQVLSSTSKIIVDSKTNNILYLPLDKYVPPTLKTQSAQLSEQPRANNPVQTAADNISQLLTDRRLIRPTY